ncbi:MAG TPA: SURF1 family protein [Afifellaceae bacterium]|nr:SURF1 family protein [Afifellaceae bacterium]
MTAVDGRIRPATILAACLVLSAFAVLVSLGNWQVRRLAWKEDLIARVAERIASPPLDMRGPLLAVTDLADFAAANEYRPVTVEGEYRDDATVHVFTSLSDAKGPLQGPGYWIFTPFVTRSGATLFINRGFVPFDRLTDAPPAPAGSTTVSGPLRLPETGNFMTPEPDLAERVWYIRDAQSIAEAIGLDGMVMPFFIDADAASTPPGGLPQAGETRTRFANSHLQYAITWYGLAAALAGVVGVYLFKRQKGPVA